MFAIAFFTRFTPAYDVIHELGTELYIAPWTRVLPYLTGVAAGYYMFSNNGQMHLEQVLYSRIADQNQNTETNFPFGRKQ